MQTQHGFAAEGGGGGWRGDSVGKPRPLVRIHRCSGWPSQPPGDHVTVPLMGCPVRATTRTSMRVHFFQQHFRDTAIILEEGKLPNPRCPRCEMLVPWITLYGRHLTTSQYSKGVESKRRRLTEEELQDILERAFQAYRGPFNTMTSFNYLGRNMTTRD